jgi:hypothetical protein
MRACHWAAALALAAIGYQNGFATEPNETFATSTVLSSGVTMVEDMLTPGIYPDVLVGARGMFGDVYVYGTASGLAGLPTNSGSIAFAVTGSPDEGFFGDHSQFGGYEVFVDAYDFFGDLVDSFSERRTLEPGEVHEFSFSDSEWISGSYDVYIDNTVGPNSAGDVDFFTFTGLSPGATFSAETFDPTMSGIDTRLAWFDAAGALIADNDDNEDDPGSLLSILEGTVPAGGALTFAVSGYEDDEYVGSHAQDDPYELKLTIGGGGFTADFNNDNMVTGADLAAWRLSFGPSATGDADGDNDTDGVDFLLWQRQVGSGVGGLAATAPLAVPEPSGIVMLTLATTAGLVRWPIRSRNDGRGETRTLANAIAVI